MKIKLIHEGFGKNYITTDGKLNLTDDQLKEGHEWVGRLRSGAYTQTRGCLADNRGFCCLGVECDANGIEKKTGFDTKTEYIFGSELCKAYPDAVWFENLHGFGHSDRLFEYGNYECQQVTGSFINLNDELHLNFDQIANVIEAWLDMKEEIDV